MRCLRGRGMDPVGLIMSFGVCGECGHFGITADAAAAARWKGLAGAGGKEPSLSEGDDAGDAV